MKDQFFQAYRMTKGRIKLIILIYLVTVFVSFIINLGVGLIISKNFTGTQAMDTLLSGFDRTIFGDMVTNNENWSGNLYFYILIVSLIYLLISVFINAVYITSIVNVENSVKINLKMGTKYYVTFLGFALFFYFIILLITAVFGFLYFSILGDPAADYRNEKPFVYSLIIVLFVLFLLINHIWVLSLNARRNYIEGNLFFNAIKRAFRQMSKKIISNTVMILLLWLMIFILFLLMKEVHKFNSANSWCNFILAFIAMQILVFCRIWIKYYFMGLVIYRKTEPQPLNQSN